MYLLDKDGIAINYEVTFKDQFIVCHLVREALKAPNGFINDYIFGETINSRDASTIYHQTNKPFSIKFALNGLQETDFTLFYLSNNLERVDENNLQQIKHIRTLLKIAKIYPRCFGDPAFVEETKDINQDLMLLRKLLGLTTFISTPSTLTETEKEIAITNTEIAQTLGLHMQQI